MKMNAEHAKSGFVTINAKRGEAMVVGSWPTRNDVNEILEQDGKWHVKKAYPTDVRGVRLVVKNTNNIYSLGGIDGSGHLKSVYRYNRALDTWTTVPEMPRIAHLINCERLIRGSKVVILCIGTDLEEGHMIELDTANEAAGWQDLGMVAPAPHRYSSLQVVVNKISHVS